MRNASSYCVNARVRFRIAHRMKIDLVQGLQSVERRRAGLLSSTPCGIVDEQNRVARGAEAKRPQCSPGR